MAATKQNFETALLELERTVKALENKDISLDEAVKLYQKGLELSKICYAKLKEHETLIVSEMTPNGEKPFEEVKE